MVRAHQEYCMQAWVHHFIRGIDKLEWPLDAQLTPHLLRAAVTALISSAEVEEIVGRSHRDLQDL